MSTKEQDANKKIADILSKVDVLIAEAENIADEAGVKFYFSGPAYGMGGYYTGGDQGWQESSSSC